MELGLTKEIPMLKMRYIGACVGVVLMLTPAVAAAPPETDAFARIMCPSEKAARRTFDALVAWLRDERDMPAKLRTEQADAIIEEECWQEPHDQSYWLQGITLQQEFLAQGSTIDLYLRAVKKRPGEFAILVAFNTKAIGVRPRSR